MVLYYDDPSFEGQGECFQAHFVLEILSLFRLILHWIILPFDGGRGFLLTFILENPFVALRVPKLIEAASRE